MADGVVQKDGIFVTETSRIGDDQYFDEMEARGFELVETDTILTESTPRKKREGEKCTTDLLL
ncbi:hypothetical protein [Haloprofundus halobius]|uniref:hypothetical protein n=1 Tax=Haloprofundus halobius TaxID=2876194 RepID=UPI001CC932B6|nr:hypothetical protein [Haloprofundus halobius]